MAEDIIRDDRHINVIWLEVGDKFKYDKPGISPLSTPTPTILEVTCISVAYGIDEPDFCRVDYTVNGTKCNGRSTPLFELLEKMKAERVRE